MPDLRQRTLVSVRITRSNSSENTTVFARSHSIEMGVPFSFDITEPTLTGAEILLGILATDVVGNFSSIARNRRLAVDCIEATLKSELANSLGYLGVIGTQGEPSYENFELRAYVDSPEDPEVLQTVWEEAAARAPLFNTLKRATSVEMTMQVVN